MSVDQPHTATLTLAAHDLRTECVGGLEMAGKSLETAGFWSFTLTDVIMLVSVGVALTVPFIMHAVQKYHERRQEEKNATIVAGCIFPELTTALLEIKTIYENLESDRKDDGKIIVNGRILISYIIPVSSRLRTHADWVYQLPVEISGRIALGAAVLEVYNRHVKNLHSVAPHDKVRFPDKIVEMLEVSSRHLDHAHSDLKSTYEVDHIIIPSTTNGAE